MPKRNETKQNDSLSPSLINVCVYVVSTTLALLESRRYDGTGITLLDPFLDVGEGNDDDGGT